MEKIEDILKFRIQNEARTQNHKAVVEEDKRNNLPKNWESRKRQADWILQDEAARKDAEEKVEFFLQKNIEFLL